MLHGLPIPPYPSGSTFSGLPRVAPYCVPGGIRVVSRVATATVRRQVQWHGPSTSGATIRRHRLPRVVECCKIRLDKPIILLAVARRCCGLRSGWCQEWCQTVSVTNLLDPLYRSECLARSGGVRQCWTRTSPRRRTCWTRREAPSRRSSLEEARDRRT
jgi:hypothetical protein